MSEHISIFDQMLSRIGSIELEYKEIDLPFEINPDKFIDWIASVSEEIYPENYGMTVCTMCEYAVLWVSKLATDVDFPEERLKICSGYYGFAEHYWLLLDDKYIIDLTLAQFENDSPKLAITLLAESIGETSYHNYDEMTYKEYILEKLNCEF